jgi:hypothetical protein
MGGARRATMHGQHADDRGGVMERGAATKGKMAKAMAGADDIEIKATIPHRQIQAAMRRFKLTATRSASSTSSTPRNSTS